MRPGRALSSAGDREPAAIRTGDSRAGTDPLFPSLGHVPPPPVVGFREAVLWSAVAHVLIFLALLFAPRGTLGPAIVAGADAEREPVQMVFVQDPSRPPEPNPEATAGSDRDRRRAQEETPPNPSRPEPFSRGNTPALIAQGPLGSPGETPLPPAPPGPPRSEPPAPGDAETPELREDEPPQEQADGGPRLREGESGLVVRAPGERDAWRERGRRLRQALSQMEAGGSVGDGGGAPFRHDNPVGGLSTPTGSLSFDTKGFDWGPYARRIYWIIWSNWHARMPPAIHTGLKGQVTVHFVIRKDGRITGIEILSPSGVPAYDNAATLALEASSPLPPLPESFPKESEGVTGRFLYNMWR